MELYMHAASQAATKHLYLVIDACLCKSTVAKGTAVIVKGIAQPIYSSQPLQLTPLSKHARCVPQGTPNRKDA